MARPRTETPDVKRARILDASRKVLVIKGYQDFRMSDVAKEADIAAGTIYLYFKDKYEMYAAVFIDLMDRLDERFKEIRKKSHGLSALKLMTQQSLAFIDEHHDFLSQCTGEHPALIRSPIGQKLKDRFVQHLGLIGKTLQECVAEKSLRPLDLSLLCIHYSFLTRMFMIRKIVEGNKKPLRHKSKELMDLFLHGAGY